MSQNHKSLVFDQNKILEHNLQLERRIPYEPPATSHQSKMHITNAIALASTLLASTVFAGPHNKAFSMSATVQLANDMSGANADVAVPADGVPYPVEELWGATAVSQHGIVEATSAQLTQFEQETICTFYAQPNIETSLNSRQTWASFEGGRVVDLCAAYVVCECIY